MKRQISIVVFSDVDGVLLDPRAPSFGDAAGTLRQIGLDDVALVLCSSKTRAELEFIQQVLGIDDPFVCENGGAAFIPNRYFDFDIPGARELAGYQAVEFGRTYADIVKTLHHVAERLGIEVRGFSEMSIDEVARECGVPPLQARLAKLREYEERFRVVGNGDPAASGRLARGLQGARLRCVPGDTFDYVGAPVDARLAVSMLSGLYRRALPAVSTVGVTDALRDENLVKLVEHPIMVLGDDVARGAVGASDWAEAIVEGVRALRRKSGGRTAAPRPQPRVTGQRTL